MILAALRGHGTAVDATSCVDAIHKANNHLENSLRDLLQNGNGNKAFACGRFGEVCAGWGKLRVYIAGADAAATKAALEVVEDTTVGVMNAQGQIVKRSTRKGR